MSCQPFPVDQVEELKAAFSGVQWASEGARSYILIPNFKLGPQCTPSLTEALLCPSERDGYMTRMFFAHQVHGAPVQNWSIHRILDREWHAYSWQNVPASLRLLQMVAAHARPLL